MQFNLLNKLVEEVRDASGDLNEEFARDNALDAGQLERLAAEVAAEHEIAASVGQGWRLLPRFRADRQSLLTTYNTLVAAQHRCREISPAVDRFLNSFDLVEEHLQIIGQRLTWRYYHDLPNISRGDLAGYPRIYAVALCIITHINGSLGADTVDLFLRAYQRTTPLKIREIRALDLTLRIVLVEKLKRLAARIAQEQAEFEEAEILADGLLELNGQRQSPETPNALPLEPEEVEEGQSTEQVMRLEHKRQSAMQSAADSIFADLISLSTLNWQELFERVSVVDAVLAGDPAAVYSSMDFVSQDSYRRAVERVAERTETSEVEAAQRAIHLASHPVQADQTEREHVGYYLVDGGLPELEKALNYRPGLSERTIRLAKRYPTPVYLVALAAMTAVVVAGCVIYALRSGADFPTLIWVSLLSLIPASEIASLGLRLFLMRIVRSSPLPKMDTSLGIPDEATTMVVVPTIFSSSTTVRESLERIEAHYLANQDRNIFFALLGDWKAAPREEMPDDNALLTAVVKGIKALNARYKEGPQDRFHLFHRHRLWNQGEGEWVGWEKKRGKLREFNRLLRGARDTSYTTCTADPTFLERVRYVISLDSDTVLPRDAARKLVGTILHPLNRPHFDADTGRVTRGYGILQPIVASPPPRAGRSRIPQILSGYVGINPCTTPVTAAAPNVYQDLFGEGNYVGKSLYDVDTFEAALTDRIPENSVLSHDLLEGLYARTALVTDVEIFDHSPINYVANSKRNHRWTRGDWQLLPWLLPRVRNARGHYGRNLLPVIGRWKIIDNLRRSLIKPATLLWLVAAWTMLPGSPTSWTVLILLMFAVPVYLDYTTELLIQLRKNRQAALRANVWALVKISTGAALSSTMYLAHQAYLMIDAITRTCYRIFISRKHLLDWVTAARIQQESTLSPLRFVGYMWPASTMALVGLALLAIKGAPALIPAAPLLLAWFVSPLFACWMSHHIQMEVEGLEKNVEMDVRLNARATWRFFATSGSNTHWLGGYQMAPERIPPLDALPINLLRLLVWMIAAHELGAIGRLELAERLEATLFSLENLQVSWEVRGNADPGRAFGTTTPHHVLIGEAGNLAAFLLALQHRCRELSAQPLFDEHVVGGLTDTLLLMKNEFLGVRAATPRGESYASLYELDEQIEMCLDFFRDGGEKGPQTIGDWGRFFNTMCQRAAVIEVMLNSFSEKYPAINVDGLRSWASYLVLQSRELNREMRLFAPWTTVRTAHVTAIIRRHCPPALALWTYILEGLDHSSSISGLPEKLDMLQAELACLCRQLEQCLPSGTVERENALKRCAELKSAIEDSLRASTDARSRYASLVNRCQAVAQADFRRLFDEEYRPLRSQFQISMVG